VRSNGTLELLSVRHVFDCSSEEFVRSDVQPAIILAVMADGTITLMEQ
jgi:hypothetical protein